MTVENIIAQTLTPLQLPVYQSGYIGKEKRYIVFNCNIIPAFFADNTPTQDRYLVAVHIFSENTFDDITIVKNARQLLFQAGFTFPTVENADDDNSKHKVLECEWSENIG